MTDRSVFHNLKAPILEPPKIARILFDLCVGKKLNCFDAPADLGETCLHSTVSDLKKYGVEIERDPAKGSRSHHNLNWMRDAPDVLDTGLYLLVTKWGYRLPQGVQLPAYNPKKQDDQPDLFE